MTAAPILFILALLARHVPQVILDVRNRRAPTFRSALPPVRAYHLIAIWCVIHLVALASLLKGPVGSGAVLLGLCLLITGCSLGLWALYTLSDKGAYHLEIVILYGAELAHEGAYALVRHPLRVALAIETFGSVLIAQVPTLLLLWLLLIVAQVMRSRYEDEFLRDYYGEEAVDYQSEVPAANLLAGAWRLLRRS